MTQTPQMPYGPPAGQTAPGMAPPPYGYPVAPPLPPAKPFYKKTWFIVLAALLAVGIIGSAASGGGDTAASGDQPSSGGTADSGDAGSGESSEIGMGQPAADGKFTFVVDKVDCSLTKIGDEYFNTTAQGTFCIVDLTITNTGDEPQSFFGDNAKLFNAEGQEYSADSEAAIYLKDSESLYSEINPGNTLKSRVVFDVPTGMDPSAIQLHDSMMSGGVTVSLD